MELNTKHFNEIRQLNISEVLTELRSSGIVAGNLVMDLPGLLEFCRWCGVDHRKVLVYLK